MQHLRQHATTTSSSGAGTPSRCRAVIILAGFGVMLRSGGMPLGIDFSGGTIVVVEFDAAGARGRGPRRRSTSLPGEKVVQQYGDAGDQPDADPPAAGAAAREQGFGLEQDANAHRGGAAQGAISASSRSSAREVVGPVVGEDLQRKGI